jgi:hypothetical protein
MIGQSAKANKCDVSYPGGRVHLGFKDRLASPLRSLRPFGMPVITMRHELELIRNYLAGIWAME